MNRTIIPALIAGLFGGVLTRYVSPPTALAQSQAQSVAKEIRSQSFTLFDQSNQPAATFTAERLAGSVSRPQYRIVLRDLNGREIWSAGGTGFQPLTAK